MKKIFFLVVILTLSLLCRAQERKYSTFYYQRATLFQEQTCQKPWNQRRYLYGSI